MNTLALLGTTLGLGVSSGLNLYAAVFGMGLALRLGWMHLAPGLETLAWLSHPIVLLVAGFLYVIEFLADKIPLVETVWDFFHTFIRPVGAALLASKAFGGTISESSEIALVLLAGGASLATHAGKSGLRVATAAAGGHGLGVGCLLSSVEDIVVFALAPLAVAHPIIALASTTVVAALMIWLAPAGFRFLKSCVISLRYAIRHKLVSTKCEGLGRGDLPFRAVALFEAAGVTLDDRVLVVPACASGIRGIPRWSSGFAAIGSTGVTFVRVGVFRRRRGAFRWDEGVPALSSGMFGFTLRCDTQAHRITLAFYPMTTAMSKRLRESVPHRTAQEIDGGVQTLAAAQQGGR